MAQYDGSIRIGTKIDISGLAKGYKKMAESVGDVAQGLDDIISGANKSSDAVTKSAKKEAESFEELNESISDVSNDIDSLNNKKIDIKIERHDTAPVSEGIEEPRTLPISANNLEHYKYNKEAIKFVEEYAEKSEESVEKNKTTLLSLIAEAKNGLKELSAQGFGPGDQEYDYAAQRLTEYNSKMQAYTKGITESVQKEIYGLDSIEGKIADVNQKIAELSQMGLGIESPEMQEQVKLRAELLETEKKIYAEASKTDAKRQAEAEKQEAAQRKIAEQAEKNLQKENARIQKEIENEAKLQAKEAERQAKIQAEAAEEQRLAQIRENAVVSNKKIVESLERIRQLEQEIADLKKAGVTKGYKDYDDRAAELSKLKQKVNEYNSGVEKTKKNYKKLGDIVKKALTPMSAILKKASSHMLGFGKSAKKSGGLISSLGSRFKGLVLSLLIFNQISKAFNAMISGIKEGFKNLYNENSAFKSQVDSLRASLLTMKNALAGAFAPIVQVAIPYIQQFISWLTSAINSIGQFIASLTGRKTYIKAIEQTAGAFEDAAGSAKDAEKAAEGYLSPLDDINKYSDGKDKGTSDGSGTGNGGAGQMFEEVPISDNFKDIAKWFKEMWADADFTELGTLLGQKLKDALEKIPWDSIQQTAAKVGKSFATLINGFVEVPGLAYTVGKTIGEGINTGIDGINSFLDNTHWDSVGKFIGEGANGIVDSVDWEGLGHLFAQKWNAVFETMGNAVETFHWSDFGESVGNSVTTAITDFRWEANGKYLGEAVSGLFKALKSFFDRTDWKSLGKGITTSISSFFGNISWEDAGGAISSFAISLLDFLTGLIQGVDWASLPQNIIDAIADFFGGLDYNGIFESVGELIGTAVAASIDLTAALGKILSDVAIKVKDFFVEKFKEAGWEKDGDIIENGKAIILGLYNGIKEVVSSIGTWIKEHIFNPFIEGFAKAFGIHSPSTVMKEQGAYIISGLLNGLKDNIGSVLEWLKNIPQWFKEKFEDAYKNAKDAFTGAKEYFKGVWDGIKDVFGNISDWFKDKFSAAWKAVKDVFSSGSDVFADIKDGILSSLKSIINSLISGINSVISIPFNGINSALDSLRGANIAGYYPFSWMPSISVPQIPYLAQGTVVPPNREFMAVLGDNKREPEVVSPISTMKQAVKEAMLEMRGNGNNGTIVIKQYLDSKQVYEAVIKNGKVRQMATGNNEFMLGTT